MTPPRIGVTLGDPGGIGPEVVLKAAVGNPALASAECVLFGERRIIAAEAAALSVPLDAEPWAGGPPRPGLFLFDIPDPGSGAVRGRPTPENGRASFRYFEEAVAAARAGRLDAIVTAPISKAGWASAGIPWRGHTEFLERFAPGAVMSFWSRGLRVALFSHHIPLKDALAKIKKDALLDYFVALDADLKRFAGGPAEWLVAGLNPHAGEGGLLGAEDDNEVRPAVEEAQRRGLRISGPYPADTVFLKALGRDDVIVIALYHDQGLIPFKLEAFASGVNVTLGLPFVRTSPDHGTAFDIAGRGLADPRSMRAAITLALRFVGGRA